VGVGSVVAGVREGMWEVEGRTGRLAEARSTAVGLAGLVCVRDLFRRQGSLSVARLDGNVRYATGGNGWCRCTWWCYFSSVYLHIH
jgi:hypothetical protein